MNTFGPSEKVYSIRLAAQMLDVLLSVFASSKVRSGKVWSLPSLPHQSGKPQHQYDEWLQHALVGF